MCVCGRGWGEYVMCVGREVRHNKSPLCFNCCTMCNHDQCYNDITMSVFGYTKSCLEHFMK